jgi:hypothetical protein
MARTSKKADLEADPGFEELRDAKETLLEEVSRSGRKGGGKLSRSETVTVRLDPKLNYLCELAARAQRRTKSSFIEWAIDNALRHVEIPGPKYSEGAGKSIFEMQSLLWDVDEPDRIVSLADNAPSLLTHEEQAIWKVIRANGFFWHGKYGDDGKWYWSYKNPAYSNIAEYWSDILKVAMGEMSPRELPTVKDRVPTTPKPVLDEDFGPDLDGEIPF